MQFSYKIFNSGSDVLLAISDSSILGRTFEEGEVSITVRKDFYSDGTCGKNKALELIRAATIVNAVGEDIVGLMKERKVVDPQMVLVVDGVPHAQVVRIQ